MTIGFSPVAYGLAYGRVQRKDDGIVEEAPFGIPVVYLPQLATETMVELAGMAAADMVGVARAAWSFEDSGSALLHRVEFSDPYDEEDLVVRFDLGDEQVRAVLGTIAVAASYMVVLGEPSDDNEMECAAFAVMVDALPPGFQPDDRDGEDR